MAGRNCQDDSEDTQLAAQRKSFVTSYTLTLALVALVLVVTLAQSNAQDFGQAKRVLVAPDVATQNDASGANGSAYFGSSRSQSSTRQQQQQQQQQQQSRASSAARLAAAYSQQATESEGVARPSASSDLGPARTTRSSAVLAEELTSPASARQTRATTRRRSTSTTTSTTPPTTTSTTTTPVPTTVFENEPPQPPATTTAATLTTYSRPPADEVTAATRTANQRVRNAVDKRRSQGAANKLRADDERDLNLDDLDEVEAELEREREQEQERLRQERRRLRHQRLRNRQQQLLANSSSTASNSSTPSSSTSGATSAEPATATKSLASGAQSTRPPSTTTTLEHSTGQQQRTSPTPRLSATTDQPKRYRQSPAVSTTAAARSASVPADRRPSSAASGRARNKTLSLLDHEYFDEDYDESLAAAAAGRLAASSQSPKKESPALSSEGGASSTTPFVATASSSTTTTNTTSSTTPSPSTVTASSESQTTQWINSLVSSLNGSLDARSPSGSLGRRLTNLITDQKNKLLPHRLSNSNHNQAGARNSNATSATTSVANLAGSTTRPLGAPWADNVTFWAGDNQTASRLDWSKLVKVVFKSFKDNSTVHTVVLNSTELDNHPVQDWTAELPKLLRRDIENLLQKWSHVFPFDHLVSDLNQIISNKTAPVITNETLKAEISQPVELASNGTLTTSSLAKIANSSGSSSSTSQASDRSVEIPNTSTSQQWLQNATTGKQELANQWTTQPPGWNHSSQNKTTTWWTNPPLKPTIANETSSFATSQQLGGSITTTTTNLTLTAATTARPVHVTSSGSRSTNFGGNLFNKSHGFESFFTTTTTTRAPLFNSIKSKSRPRDEAAKDLEEMVRDLRDEQTKIEDDVKEQGNSLRHFIIICSISVVLSTSLVVALIVLLFK